MPPVLAASLFLVSLAVTLAAARLFARRLDRLGVRFGFPEALIGLLTALAADGPEISSALYALIKGAHDVGVGVLVGSNGFNLAAMIGLSALLTGRVGCSRRGAPPRGHGWPPRSRSWPARCCWPGSRRGSRPALSAVVLIPYLVFVLIGSRMLESQRPRSHRRLASAARASWPRAPRHSANPTHHLLALIVLDVALIIAGSAGMVQTALTLARRLARLGRDPRRPDPRTADQHPERGHRDPARPSRPRRRAGR